MRTLPRIGLASVIVTGIALAPAPGLAQAQQKFPSKPVRIVVTNPAGSQGDTLARMIGLKLSESWGGPVVVDNRTGAVGTLAGAMVAKATPDGHTLLFTAGLAIGAAMQASLPYDPVKDFAGVTQIGFGPSTVVAPHWGSSREGLIAPARPTRQIIYGSSAVGTGHMNGED